MRLTFLHQRKQAGKLLSATDCIASNFLEYIFRQKKLSFFTLLLVVSPHCSNTVRFHILMTGKGVIERTNDSKNIWEQSSWTNTFINCANALCSKLLKEKCTGKVIKRVERCLLNGLFSKFVQKPVTSSVSFPDCIFGRKFHTQKGPIRSIDS